MLSIFKEYIAWRKRRIAINEAAWQIYRENRTPSVTIAALRLKRMLRKQGIEIDEGSAIVRMRKLMKGY